MSRFNETKTTEKTENLAGGMAFSKNVKEELAIASLTTFLKDQYYESGDERLERITTLSKEVIAKDPLFVAKLALVAREEFHMRSAYHVLIGLLSKFHKGDTAEKYPSLVRKLIPLTAERVDDLTEIIAFVGKPIPNSVKKGVAEALKKFDSYQLAKYRSNNKIWKLVDIFNLVHPKPTTESHKDAWALLVNDELKNTDTWEAKLSAAGSQEEKKEVWTELVLSGKIGYMALLRNLRNLVKENVSKEVIDAAAKRIADPEQVAKSKQLPFRFATAYKYVEDNRTLRDAISDAIDASVANVPRFDGKTLIAIDSSGSMCGSWGSDNSDAAPIRIAAIFGAALAKVNQGAEVVLYDTSIKKFQISSKTPVIDIAEKIETSAMGGGTKTSLVFEYAQEQTEHYDRIIILSDNESWVEGWSNHSVQDAYNTFKNITDTDPYIYAIDIQGYGTDDIKSAKVLKFAGWSEKILTLMNSLENAKGGIVKYIESKELDVE